MAASIASASVYLTTPVHVYPSISPCVDKACAELEPFSGKPIDPLLIQLIQLSFASCFPTDATGPARALHGRATLTESERCFMEIVHANLKYIEQLLQTSRPVYFPVGLIEMASAAASGPTKNPTKLEPGAFGTATVLHFSHDRSYVSKTPVHGHEKTHQQEIENGFRIPPHKNIVDFCGIIPAIPKDQSASVVSQYMSGGDLLQFLSTHRTTPPFDTILHIAKELMEAVRHLHRHHCVHCDIKPENVTLEGPLVKLIDFGCSMFTEGDPYVSSMKPLQGTTNYCPPEYFKTEMKNQHTIPMVPISAKADIWSLGCTLLELYNVGALISYLYPDQPKKDSKNADIEEFGKLRHYLGADDLQLNISEILSIIIDLTSSKQTTSNHPTSWFHAVVTACLTVDPGKRPSIEELCTLLPNSEE